MAYRGKIVVDNKAKENLVKDLLGRRGKNVNGTKGSLQCRWSLTP